MMRGFSISILSLFLFCAQAFAFGESNSASTNTNPLTASAQLQPAQIEVGKNPELVLDLNLEGDYHAYLDRFKVEIAEPQGLKLGDVMFNPIVQFYDTVSKSMKYGVRAKSSGNAKLDIGSLPPGEYTLKLKLTYQACTEEHCLFPKTIDLETPFKVIAAGVAQLSAADSKPVLNTDDYFGQNGFKAALGKGLLFTLVIVFFAGLLTSFTPCIYPMIPITIAVLGANSANRSRTKSLTLSITYVLGIAVTYAIAGVIAAKTGALFGALLSNVYVVSGIAAIFIVMALSMFGFYEIQAPAFVRNRLGTAQTGGGIVGAFATGLIAGIVASPCVGPVLVGVLAHVAQTQDAVLGFALLFTFAVGMGTLFIAIGLSSSVLNKLPKSGAWMEAPKFLFGVILVGMAFYYIKPIYPEWLFRVLIGVALILFGSAEGPFRHGQGLLLKEKLRKGLALALVVMGAAFVFAGTVQRLYPQGFINAEQTSTTTKLPWQPFSDDALKTAIDQKKPVIIDFYADWCAACVELEKDTFPDPRIQAQAGDFVWLKVDATEESAELDRVRKIYEVVGLPTMIFYDKNGQIRKDLTLTGFEKADLFLKRMEAIR